MLENTVGRRKTTNKDLPTRLRLKNGLYYYVINVDGKTRWYPLQTQDKGDALRKWADIEAQVNATLVKFDVEKLGSKKRTFRQLAKEYYEEVTLQKSPNTQRSEIPRIELLVDIFKDKWVDKIERQEIILYHRELKDIPYEANRRIALISHMLQCARNWGYTKINVADRIPKYKEKKIQLNLTTEILFSTIYPKAEPMLKRAIMLAWHLTQHENEIKKLKWTDFEPQSLKVSFERSKTDVPIVVNYSKNETFKAYIQYLFSTRRELCPYIVCHQSPRGWTGYSSFKSMWKKVLKACDLEGYMFKEIRHLSNDIMGANGVHVRNRMAMTGHKTIQANEIYTHITGEDSIPCGEKLSLYSPAEF